MEKLNVHEFKVGADESEVIPNWDWSGAFYFCITTVTTIGEKSLRLFGFCAVYGLVETVPFKVTAISHLQAKVDKFWSSSFPSSEFLDFCLLVAKFVICIFTCHSKFEGGSVSIHIDEVRHRNLE